MKRNVSYCCNVHWNEKYNCEAKEPPKPYYEGNKILKKIKNIFFILRRSYPHFCKKKKTQIQKSSTCVLLGLEYLFNIQETKIASKRTPNTRMIIVLSAAVIPISKRNSFIKKKEKKKRKKHQ